MFGRIRLLRWFGPPAIALAVVVACRASRPPGSSTAVPGVPRAPVPVVSGGGAHAGAGAPHADDDPAIKAARRLFPAAFGLPSDDGKPFARAATMYSLFDEQQGGLDAPDACVNLIGQPAMVDDGFAWAIRNDGDYELFSSAVRTFELAQPLLFRDPESGYVLAVPAGATGGVMIQRPDGADGWQRQELARVLLDRLVVLDRRGGGKEIAAMLSIATSGVVRLCAVNRESPSPECGPEESSREGLPYEYDFMRCAPGCDAWCGPGRRKLRSCDEPRAPECIGGRQRQFFGGRDIGGSCLHEEWEFRCAKGCAESRCDDGSPKLGWSLSLASNRNSLTPVFLGEGAVATLAGNELVAVSSSGRPLWRQRLPRTFVFSLSSDGQGRAFTLDRLGDLRAFGASHWEKKMPRANRYGTLLFAAPNLYARWETRVFAHDPATGELRFSTDIGGQISGGPARGPFESVMVVADRDIVLLDAAGTIRSRVRLPAKPRGVPVVTSRGEILVATEAGEVLFGPLDALRPIASFAEPVVFDPALSGDGAALFVTRTGKTDAHTIRRIALPSGAETWKQTLGWVDGAPLVDGRGNVIVLGESVRWFNPEGMEHFSLDLRSGGGRSARALLGNETLYLQSHARLTALAF